MLADGPVPVKEIKAGAAEAGISWATLRRAQQDLKVAFRRIGYGKGGKVVWELPMTSTDVSNNENIESKYDLSEQEWASEGPHSCSPNRIVAHLPMSAQPEQVSTEAGSYRPDYHPRPGSNGRTLEAPR